MAEFPNVLQPPFEEVFEKNYALRGKWNREFFTKEQPLVLELGCGRGEYTVGLAQHYPGKNFIGIDIKGARIWKGARAALEGQLENVAFLRSRVDFINSFFAAGEVDEIWITFPDPQPKKALKRLTSSRFLNRYQKLLKNEGCIHLKTDSSFLYEYTLSLAKHNGLKIEVATEDLYQSGLADEILSIRTYYENMWLNEGLQIKYLQFRLPDGKTIIEPPDED